MRVVYLLALLAVCIMGQTAFSAGKADTTSAPDSATVSLSLSSFPAYPGYSGDQVIDGSVQMEFQSATTSVTISYDITGVQSECIKPGVHPLSCGIHIHSGQTCDNANDVGDTYYNSAVLDRNPWPEVTYSIDVTKEEPTAFGDVTVNFGFTWQESDNHAFVIHDYDGNRMVCTLLMQNNMPTPMPTFYMDKGMSIFTPTIQMAPDYNPSMSGPVADGWVSLVFSGGDTVVMQYDLWNVQPECIKANKTLSPVSCGIHIHEGTNCTSLNAIGGLYYNTAENPWYVSDYVANADNMTTATGYSRVMYGYDYGQTLGHVFIMHAYNGDVMTCAVIEPYTETTHWTKIGGIAMFDFDLQQAPQYPGDTEPNGIISMIFSGTTVNIYYEIYGVQPECYMPNKTLSSVSCGLHIHQGTNCTSLNAIGGLYYGTMNDPWAPYSNYYAMTPQSHVAIGMSHVTFGYDWDQTQGHDLILHAYNGDVMMCNPIPPMYAAEEEVVQGVAYFNYDLMTAPGYDTNGGIMPNGFVEMVFQGTAVKISYELYNIQPECYTPNPADPISCGLHIHEGTSCENQNDIGGLYYPADWMEVPWYGSHYYADGPTNTSGTGLSNVAYGYNYDQTVGHVFIMHAYNGDVAICNVIQPMYSSPPPKPYVDGIAYYSYDLNVAPGYDPADTENVLLLPNGFVSLVFSGLSVKMSYQLYNVQPECANPDPSVDISCGMHIHVNTKMDSTVCDDSNQIGGLYFNDKTNMQNPWFGSHYYANTYDPMTNSMTMAVGENDVMYGYDWKNTVGNLFIMHAYDGTVIVCNVLQEMGGPRPQPPPLPMVDGVAYFNFDLHTAPGYTASMTGGQMIEPQGFVSLIFTELSVTISYELYNIQPECATPNASIGISCGLHIHKNANMGQEVCNNASMIEGLYYNQDSNLPNPWLESHYYANQPGMTSGVGQSFVTFGYDWENTVGNLFIMHAYDGTVIICNVLQPMEDASGKTPMPTKASSPTPKPTPKSQTTAKPTKPSEFSTPKPSKATTAAPSSTVNNNQGMIQYDSNYAPAPGWNGSLPSGGVSMIFDGESVSIYYTLYNVEEACQNPASDDSVSCGLHIHAGTSCETQDSIGNFYFNPQDTTAAASWEQSTYIAQPDGTAQGVSTVYYGYDYQQTLGHLFVMHAYNGDFMTCNVIVPIPDVPDQPYSSNSTCDSADDTKRIETLTAFLIIFMILWVLAMAYIGYTHYYAPKPDLKESYGMM